MRRDLLKVASSGGVVAAPVVQAHPTEVVLALPMTTKPQ